MGKNQIANKIKELETQISKLKEQAKETNIKEAIATIKLIKTEKIETTQIIDEIKVKLKKNNEKTNDYNITYRREGNKTICTFSNGIYTGIGIARCNPEDEFNYFDGCILAEHRARSDFYIKVAEGYVIHHSGNSTKQFRHPKTGKIEVYKGTRFFTYELIKNK